jgi:hypothetical protein
MSMTLLQTNLKQLKDSLGELKTKLGTLNAKLGKLKVRLGSDSDEEDKEIWGKIMSIKPEVIVDEKNVKDYIIKDDFKKCQNGYRRYSSGKLYSNPVSLNEDGIMQVLNLDGNKSIDLIDLDRSKIKCVRLKGCSVLEKLILTRTDDVEFVYINGAANLESIEFTCGYCMHTKLEHLVLKNIPKLKTLDLSESFRNKLIIEDCGMVKINWYEDLKY